MKVAVELIQLGLAGLYIFLTGVGPSFYWLWSYAAVIFILVLSSSFTFRGVKKPLAFWSFALGANGFMLFVHVMWYFDTDGAKTGSSTSALIFAVMPIWAFIFGGALAFLNGLVRRLLIWIQR